jgi:hypothetical protein
MGNPHALCPAYSLKKESKFQPFFPLLTYHRTNTSIGLPRSVVLEFLCLAISRHLVAQF